MNHTKTAGALSALAAILVLTMSGFAVNAQTGPGGPPPPMGPGGPPMGPGERGMREPASEGDFVRGLDAVNTAELDIAKYVVNRTKDPTVHAYAQRMIDDHSTAAVKLEAATRGTNLRPAPREREASPMSYRVLEMLRNESGAELDENFMRAQVPAHRRTLALLQWEIDNGRNTGLKNLATNLAPTVQQHLDLAQNYLAAHNLSPYAPPAVRPVPGHVNPNGPGTPNGTAPNNPASAPANGSSSGQNAPSGPTIPVPGATPGVPLSTGTAPPAASPSPMASSRP